jgi:DNA-binding SARP family transcriptional activator
VNTVNARHDRDACWGSADVGVRRPRFMILGPLEVQSGQGTGIPVSPPLDRQVLATLILSADVPRTSTWLTRAVWGDRPPGDPAGSLRTAVRSLRRRLGASACHLKSPDQGCTYMFSAAGLTVDVALFAGLARCGRAAWYRGDAARAADLLAAAAGLWREPVLADVPGTPVLGDAREELLRGRADVESLWLDARLALGGHREAVGDIRLVLDRYPLREHAWAQLMLALHRCGRDSEALRAFADAQAVFHAEYGADPGPELTEIRQMILDGHTREGAPQRTPGLRPAPRPAGDPPRATRGARPQAAGSCLIPMLRDRPCSPVPHLPEFPGRRRAGLPRHAGQRACPLSAAGDADGQP